MNEEENGSVATEEVAEAVAPAAESEQVQQNKLPSKPRKGAEQEYNWAEANKAMKELSRQNRELADQVQRLQKPAAPEPEEDYGIGDDDLAAGKHVKELKKELKQLKSYMQQKELSSVEERLSVKFNDYADVVSKENVELLKQIEPELARSLSYGTDPYTQGVSAYKLIKRLGIGQDEVPDAPEKKRAIANSQKPVSVNAVSKSSALAEVNQFSEMDAKGKKEFLKQQYAEMQKAMKG